MTLSFKSNKSTKLPNPNKGKIKAKVQVFAKALLGPITLLAFAGIFLGVGSVIAKYTADGSGAQTVAIVIKNIGNIVFTLLPLLFAIAIASSFTGNSGTAVLTAVVAYFAILMITSGQFVAYTRGTGAAAETGFSWFGVIDFKSVDHASIMESTLGVKTLQFNVFGGFIAGPIAVWAYNKFKDQRLPLFLQMFQGERTVPIMAIVVAVPVSFLLALVWPWISHGFILFGQYSGKLPAGLDSFLFGLIERTLLPTGLHHMFYSPLLYTTAGGSIDAHYTLAHAVNIGSQTFAVGTPLYGIDASPFVKDAASFTDTMPSVAGVQVSAAEYTTRASEFTTLAGDRTMFQTLNGSSIQFSWINEMKDHADNVGVHLGRFSAGKFPLMVFWIPAAGLAMVMAAPKENRKVALGVVGAATLTSFLTGITEPFEYTFLFVAPAIFFGFHVWMAALSYMLSNLAGVYYGPTFGGVIDYGIYGIVPHVTGQATNFYWLLAIGIGGAAIYYPVFYFSIKKWNLKTPGRDGAKVKLFTKADFKAKKAAKVNGANAADPLEQKGQIMYKALGGKSNIAAITNCASRLRVTLTDPKLIDYDLVAQAQPFGIAGKGKPAEQFVFGPNVIIITQKVKDIMEGKLKEDLSFLDEDIPTPKVDIKETKAEKAKPMLKKPVIVKSPVNGTIKKLSSIDDEVFAGGMVGEGIAITPKDGKFYSPVSGKLIVLFPTKHAYGIETKEGVSLLIHIGCDTVKLDGEGFKTKLKAGQEIKAGDLLVEVDLKAIKSKVPSIDTPMVITPESKGTLEILVEEGKVTKNTDIFRIV